MGQLWRPDEFLSEKDLVLPGVTPDNLKLDGSIKSAMITSDVFNICERLKELNPRLEVHAIWDDRPGGDRGYAIMERTGPHETKLVFKCRELDARVIHEVQYLIGVPFEERMKRVEKLLADEDRRQKEEELDKLYEDMGRAMWFQLEHDGFIETRGVSHPKRGIKPRD